MNAHDIEKTEGTGCPSVMTGATLDAGARKDGAYVFFGVYAPFADKVWLVGSFNDWQESHMMKKGNDGVWRIRVNQRHIPYGTAYKYKVYVGTDAEYIADPYALETERGPFFNSVYRDTSGKMPRALCPKAFDRNADAPLTIYKLRLDRWLCDKKGFAPDYVSLARELLPYILQMGYSHIAISGMAEGYHDPGLSGIKDSCFIVRSGQGGADLLTELVNTFHSAGVGVLIEPMLANSLGDDKADMAFHTDNICYWLGSCNLEGILIDRVFGRSEEFLTGLVHNIKLRCDGAFIVNCRENGAYIGTADAEVGCAGEYLPLFKNVKTYDDAFYARAAAMICLLAGDGGLLTRMGDELAQTADAGELFDRKLQNEGIRARFQMLCSEMNYIYGRCKCLQASERGSRKSRNIREGLLCIKKSDTDEELEVYADISGCGKEICIGEPYPEILLDSKHLLGARDTATVCMRRGEAVLGLPPYGAVVLRREKTRI